MRQSLSVVLVLALGAAISACAGSIQSMMLTDDTALVSAVGDRPEDRGKVIDASLREAARLTVSKGYRYFVVMDAADASKTGQRLEAPRPTQRERNIATPVPFSGQLLTAPVYRNYFKPLGNNVTYVKPGLDITIRMYREGEVDPKSQGVWNTADLLNPAASVSQGEP
jgi:hypothetical protein